MSFQREERYIVLKKKDLSEQMLKDVRRFQQAVEYGRSCIGEPVRRYAVIEADWPEYEPAWDAIERRMEERPSREAELLAELEQLRKFNDLERDIAYNAARSDIESWCVGTRDEGGVWYDVTSAESEEEQGMIDMAVEYLECRSLLTRHPRFSQLVHIVKVDTKCQPDLSADPEEVLP